FSGVGHEKNYEQKQQRQVIEFGAEGGPHRDSLARLPPGGKREAQHVQCAQRRCRPYPDSQQQAHSYKQLDHSDQISEKLRVRQHQVSQNRLIEAHRAVLDETLKVLLESAVSELGAENLVLAEEQKENRRGYAHRGDSF